MLAQMVFSPLSTPVEVIMNFYTSIPKSWSKKKRNEAISSPDPRRPDIDNYAKFYADGMNKVVICDDSQIVYLACKKIFSINPRTEIVVKKYPEMSP